MRKIAVFFIIIAVIIALALIGILFLQRGSLLQFTPTAQTPHVLKALDTDPYKGVLTAPVTIIVVGSFTCPACRVASITMDQLLALYPQELRIVWKDFPEDSGASYKAALAARCAQRQGKFWQYHDRLFIKQAVLEQEKFYSIWAADLGLRVPDFERCMKEREMKSFLDRSISEVLLLNIEKIPYFQINETEALGGTQNLAVFQSIIDGLLGSNKPAL